MLKVPRCTPCRGLCLLVAFVVAHLSGWVPQVPAETVEDDVARLAERLGHPDREERRRAVYALNGLGASAVGALEALIEAIGDDDDQVWNQAVMTLANLGPSAAPAIPRLIETIGRRSRSQEQRRLRVAFALGKVGSPAVEPLRDFLSRQSPDENGRWAAAKALGWIGESAADAIPEILPLLEDDAEAVRREAAEALARIGPASRPALIDRLAHESGSVRKEAIYALRRLDPVDAATRGALLDAFDREADLAVKCEMLLALVALEVDRELATPILVESLLSGEEPLVHAAMDAMIAQDRPEDELLPSLTALLRSPEKRVRLSGIRALGVLGERASGGAPALISSLRSPDVDVEESAAGVNALIAMGTLSVRTLLAELPAMSFEELTEDHWSMPLLKTLAMRAQPILEAHAESESPQVRYLLLVALQELPKISPAVKRLVTASLQDPEGRVRAQASLFLPRLRLAPPLRASLLQRAAEDDDPRVRRAAVAIAPAFRDRDLVLGILTKALADGDEDVQREAVMRLGELGERAKPAIRPLLAKLESDPEPMKALVLQSMAEMGSAAVEALPLLTEMSQGASYEGIRKEVYLCLSALGGEAAAALPQVREGLGHADAEVRAAALSAFVRIEEGSEKRLAVLADLLEDPAAEVRLAAIQALGALGSGAESAAPKIWTVLAKSDEPRPVLEALRKIPYGKTDIYLEALKHEDPAVRLFACDRLGDLGEKAGDAIPALQKAENDRYSFVARRARQARRKIEGRGRD